MTMDEMGSSAQTGGHSASGGMPQPPAAVVLADVFAAIRSHWRVMIVAPLAGAIVFVGLSFAVTPKYKAVAIYAPVATTQRSGLSSLLGGQLSGVAAMAGLPTGGADVQRIAALTKSRVITLTVLRGEQALPMLFPRKWDASAGKWKKPSGGWFGAGEAKVAKDGGPSDQDIIDKFQPAIMVNADALTNLVTVEVTLSDPAMAARLANRLAHYVNDYERSRASEESKRAIEFLGERLQTATQSSLRDSMTGLLDSEMQKQVLVHTRDDYIVDVVDPAIVPERKDSPKRAMFAMFGLLLGAAAGLFYAMYTRQYAAQ